VIAVFVRPALAGGAKTRLIPALGAEGAALLYRAMAGDVIEQACLASPGNVVCWVAGISSDADLDFIPPTLPRRAQPQLDLGDRMRIALEYGIESAGRALVVGTDAPGLSAATMLRSLADLSRQDAVLGPAADGGYTSIGARRTHPAMFEGVRMSTCHALADTQRACEAAGLSVGLGEPWFDIDTPADLTTLHALIGTAPGRAPRTAQALLRLADQRFDRIR